MRLIIAGGGTGGHVYPGISLAREWLSRDSSNEVAFVGTAHGIEAKILPREGFELFTISVGRLKGQRALTKVMTLAGLIVSMIQSLKILIGYKPELVIGVGGYASGPLVLAAWMHGIKTCIQEQNSIPGITNKILGKFVKRIFISFPETADYFSEKKVSLTGNPIRKEIAEMDFDRTETGKNTLLIFGGSQGAHRINTAMIEALPFLDQLKDRLDVIHQTGESDLEEAHLAYSENVFGAEVEAFIYNMPEYYRKADLLICRAGATSIAEILCSGLPAIFVPFPFAADNHQEINALSLVKRDAAEMIIEKELTGQVLGNRIKELITDEDKRREMGRRARELARPDAAKDIIDQCLELIQGRN